MERYLPKFISSIPENQRIEFLKILNAMVDAGEISQDDIDLGRIVASIDTSNVPMTKVSELEDKIRSVPFNETMMNIYVDLNAIFRESNISSFSISRNEMINKDIVAIIRARLDGVLSRLTAIQTTASEKVTSARHENFSDENRMVFNGTFLSGDRKLILGPISEESRSYNTGADIRSVKKEILPAGVGIDVVPHPDQDLLYDYSDSLTPKRKLRTSTGTNRELMAAGIGNNYWRETILTDRPVVHQLNGERFDGVLIILTINFTRSRDINSIIIDPFSDRDVEIYKIRYLGRNSQYHTATFFDKSRVYAKSNRRIHLKNIRDINRTSSIEIWFHQRNFRRTNILVDGNKYYEELIWNDMLAGEYNDIASRYAPGELTKNARDYTIEGLIQNREYDRAINLLLQSSDPIATTKRILNLDDKEDVSLDRAEYTLGAYSISPQTVVYPAKPGTFVSHRPDEGYVADIRPITDIQLEAEYDIPALTTVEFYIEDERGKVEIPIAPNGTTTWRQYVEPTGTEGFITFDTTFPVTSGSLNVYRNGQNIDDIISPSLVQIDASGSKSTTFEATGVYRKEDDIFVIEYDINHDYRITASQRRATIVTLRDEVPPSLVIDSTVDNTISVRENVLTLSRYPYAVLGECNTDINSFPFTLESVPLSIFNKVGKGDQRELDVEGFIPYMKIEMDPFPDRTWVLWGIYHSAGTYKLQFTTTIEPTIYILETELETTPGDVDVIRELTLLSTGERVGEVRINWTNVSGWNAVNYFNVFLNQALYDPPTLQDAIKYGSRYGRGAVVRPEVMVGILVGEDLSNPLNTLKGIFASSRCPVLVAINETIAEDKTDYQRPTQDPLDPYEQSGTFQYFINGNKIYMNVDMEHLGSQNRIDVLYWHLTKMIRLKAILRSNERAVSKYTPVISDYTLKFRSQ